MLAITPGNSACNAASRVQGLVLGIVPVGWAGVAYETVEGRAVVALGALL